MEITYATKYNNFLNDWLSQIKNKVHFIPNDILTESLQYIEEQGIPDIKDEAYKYIPIQSILKQRFKKLVSSSIQENHIKNIPFLFQTNQITLAQNNYYSQAIEKGIEIYNNHHLSEKYNECIGKTQIHQKDFFAALNTAYSSDFTIVHIHQSLQYPLQITHYLNDSSNFSQHRILFIIDKDVQCTILENYYANNLSHPYFYNHLTEVFIEKYANVRWISLQNNTSCNLYNINNTAFSLEKSSNLKHHQISLQSALWRNNLFFHINDENVKCELFGLSFGKKQTIISQNTSVIHRTGWSHSNQLYKNIADDKSLVLFNGFIRVDKNAQKTDAYQNSKNLLLNDYATIFAKPQLEIYADDVKCSHGSTTGSFNEDALFYLKTRGIEQQEAQKILLQAFYYDIIESIENTDIQTYIQQNVTI